MNFEHNDKTKELIARLEAFMDAHIYPADLSMRNRWKHSVKIVGRCRPFWKN